MDFSPVDQFELKVPTGAQAPNEALPPTVQHLVEAPESLHILEALAPPSHAALLGDRFVQLPVPIHSQVTERTPGSIRRLARAAKGNQSGSALRQTLASIGGGLLMLPSLVVGQRFC